MLSVKFFQYKDNEVYINILLLTNQHQLFRKHFFGKFLSRIFQSLLSNKRLKHLNVLSAVRIMC